MAINWSMLKREKAFTPGGNRINVLIAVKNSCTKKIPVLYKMTGNMSCLWQRITCTKLEFKLNGLLLDYLLTKNDLDLTSAGPK